MRQLEEGLKRLRFDPGPLDGTYDEQTSAAVAEWYKSVGYTPFWPTAEQLPPFAPSKWRWATRQKSRWWPPASPLPPTWPSNPLAPKHYSPIKTATAEIQAKIAERALIVLDPRQLATARSAADAKIEVCPGRVEIRSNRG